jgi:carboxylesterase type B
MNLQRLFSKHPPPKFTNSFHYFSSSGAASVNYHMVSPLSKGLFEKAISQSGSLMNPWADAPRPGLAKMRAIRLTSLVNCPISNTNFQKMIECLRKVDAKKITEAIAEFYVSLLFKTERFAATLTALIT